MRSCSSVASTQAMSAVLSPKPASASTWSSVAGFPEELRYRGSFGPARVPEVMTRKGSCPSLQDPERKG
jgi:hypothetical protein